MDAATLISFMGGLGVGSIIGALVKHWLEQRAKMSEIWLKEYREVAFGLLDTYREIALEPSDKASKSFALWELKLQLLASGQVVKAVDDLLNSAPGSRDRSQAQKDMIAGMRKDLGIAQARGFDL